MATLRPSLALHRPLMLMLTVYKPQSLCSDPVECLEARSQTCCQDLEHPATSVVNATTSVSTTVSTSLLTVTDTYGPAKALANALTKAPGQALGKGLG